MVKRVSNLIIEQLVDLGVNYIFGIPGFTNLDIIDELREIKKVKFIMVRHEETAALMASAYAKITDKLGVCTSIAGPGATNLISGLYDAKMDRAPVLAITGQVESQFIGTHEIQEIDQKSLFESVSEFNKTITTPNEAAEMIFLAAKYAIINRGVSHIGIPTNIQASKTNIRITPSKKRIPKIEFKPTKKLIEEAADIIDQAVNPVIIMGWGARYAVNSILKLAEKIDYLIATTFKAKGLISEYHPRVLGVNGSVGTKAAKNIVYNSDLLIVLGCSSSKQTVPKTIKTIQIDIDDVNIGKRFPVHLGILSNVEYALPDLIEKVKEQKRPDLMDKVAKLKLEWDKLLQRDRNLNDEPIKPPKVLATIRELADEDAIFSLDVGDNSWWFGRHFKLNGSQKIVLSGYFGIMGFGLASGLAAKIAYPKKQSITIIGDGALSMLMTDFTTAVKYNLPIKVILYNNSELSMIRHEQLSSHFPPYGIKLINPDFPQFANTVGGLGIKVKKVGELKRAIKKALELDKPALVEIFTDSLAYWESD
ncbi:MAG: thiamine pyrophosphate-binding protein [Candidatus Odinarchaeia archaeon]